MVFFVKLHQAHNKNISARHIRAGSFVARQQQSGATVLILQRGMTGMMRPPSQTPFYLGPDWTEVRFCRLLFLTWLEDPGGGTDRWTKNTVLHSERTRAGGNKQKGKNVFGGVEVRGVSIQCTGSEIYEDLSHCEG